jgi:hypothetical protein
MKALEAWQNFYVIVGRRGLPASDWASAYPRHAPTSNRFADRNHPSKQEEVVAAQTASKGEKNPVDRFLD